MTQQHSAIAEIDAPALSVDDRPDVISLFIATVVVAAVVYLATAATSWPRWQNRQRLTTQHKGASGAGSQAATSASTDCFTQSSTSSPHTGIRTRAPPEYTITNTALRRPWQPPEPQLHPLSDEPDHKRPNQPFRFRAPDLAAESDASVFASPLQPHKRRKVQFLTPQAAHKLPWDPDDLSDEDEPVSNWDPELLDRCAANSPFISSVEALQRSPEYRSHIKAVRGRQLQYETAESHKLKVYKALREVDPPGLQQLFSRKDIKEFDDVTLSRLLSACECLISSCLTLALLLLPSAVPTLRSYGVATALVWCCLYIMSVRRGCLSPVAWLLSVYSTYGEYQMAPPWWRMLTAVVLEAGLVVLTAGTGVLGTLLCRMLTQQRQGFGERVLQLVPLREVVRPVHFK